MGPAFEPPLRPAVRGACGRTGGRTGGRTASPVTPGPPRGPTASATAGTAHSRPDPRGIPGVGTAIRGYRLWIVGIWGRVGVGACGVSNCKIAKKNSNGNTTKADYDRPGDLPSAENTAKCLLGVPGLFHFTQMNSIPVNVWKAFS